MKLSLFSDYSLRVLMYAALKDGLFQLDDAAAAYGVSRNHVAQVIHHLAKLGYLRTQRGRGGGVRLAVLPAEVRLGKLVRETEDQPVFVECFNPVTNTCPVIGACRLKSVLAGALNEFYASLDRYTLRDLITGPQQSRLGRTLLVSKSQNF